MAMSMPSSGGGDADAIASINTTPLVDVMLDVEEVIKN